MASEVSLESFDMLAGLPTVPNKDGKKSWDELRKSVRESTRLLSHLKSTIPSSFVFRKIETDSETRTRIYFLGVPKLSRENTLMFVDLPASDETEKNDFMPKILDWEILLESFKTASAMGHLSREEQLMRERKRLVLHGITSFDFYEPDSLFVFPANNNLYHCCDTDSVLAPESVTPKSINTYCHGARMDPKICPTDVDIIAFIHDNDIWVTHLTSGCEKRLTFAHKGTGQLSTDPLSSGVPSFVIQEEFDRHTGYWWKPVYTHSTSESIKTHQILYEEVDESEVDVLNLFAPSTEDHGIDEYRYPRAGTANAKSSLKILEFEVDSDGMILDTMVEKQLREPLCVLFPWYEYIVRAGWTPCGKYIYSHLLDRKQERSILILIPLEQFIPVTSDIDMSNGINEDYQPIQILYQETSHIWINTHDNLQFLSQCNDDNNNISFIWSSERTGFRHLYYIQCEIIQSSINSNTITTDTELDCLIECPECCKIKEVSLTRGDWEVLPSPVWLDEDRKLVYFTGLKDTPLESHLYYVSYESPGEPVRLTPSGFSHSITMDSNLCMFVSVYSSVQQSPRATVSKLIFNNDNTITTKTLAVLMEHSVCPQFHAPEIFNYQAASGCLNYGMYYKPHNYQPGCKYPTVLFVYGGPQVQLVSNSFKSLKFLRLYTLASQGYAVVVLDCRGSSHRGLMYESILKDSLGTVEIDEQVEGLFYLNSKVDFIDIDRVAIHGWSYGGYLSLMGLAQKPEIFKCAIAGAPVVDWSLYDTGYTERYLGLPATNIQAYKQGCVLSYIDSFPDEENRLLIIHGLIDENVHFHHSNYLINTLVKHCKPYQLQVYPNERHGIRGHEASEHYKTMVLSFLQNNL